MEIDWRILAAAIFVIVASYVLLFRAIVERNRDIDRLEAENKQLAPELLRARGEHAQEIADLKADYSKRIVGLQRNVNDLTVLLKQQNKSGWDGWMEKQRTP
jgi:F0F1-type ATP synthase membrane subunit b/b'